MNLSEFIDFKYDCVKKIIQSQEIISLLVDNASANPDDYDLTDKQIFSYPYNPEVATESLSYICLDVNIKNINNNIISEGEISIWIFTHYTLNKLPSNFKRKGNRIDNLATELDKIFNGERLGIGKVQLKPTSTFAPAKNYTGKQLMYRVFEFNQNIEQSRQ